MKKVVEGKFCDIYYNNCEAACPLGIEINNEKDDLCSILKDLLGIDDGAFSPDHQFLNKKVKITVEIED